ncbi:MAG: Smr/MutS family protein [Desulfobacteraceae bacterium]
MPYALMMFWKKKKKRASCQKNKNGIPVFTREDDIVSLFTCDDHENGDSFRGKKSGRVASESPAPGRGENRDTEAGINDEEKASGPGYGCRGEAEQQGSGGGRRRESFPDALGKKKKVKTDRHGLPLLDGAAPLSKMFYDNARDEDARAFSRLIDASIKGRKTDALLLAKKDKPAPDPVPLKKRLKRYPPPEKKLDLHGQTAFEAEARVVSFVRTARRNGHFTLRIVVGRGIHSPQGAVLPDVVADLLARLKKEGSVLWFEWDRKKRSKSGALIVYLNRFND